MQSAIDAKFKLLICWFWGLVAIVLIVTGIVALANRPELRRQEYTNVGDMATSDYLMRINFGNQAKSRTFAEALAALPGTGPALLIARHNDPQLVMSVYLSSYLAWPRNVWALTCDESGREPSWLLGPTNRDKPAGIILVRLSVPKEITPLAAVTPDLIVIRQPENDNWKSFC